MADPTSPFRQLRPSEINAEAIEEVTPPWEIAGMFLAPALAARAAFSRLVPTMLARRAIVSQSRRMPVSRPGLIAELAERGELTRPWSGVYRGSLTEGRTPIQSYRSPYTEILPESAEELPVLLKSLGGHYGPIP